MQTVVQPEIKDAFAIAAEVSQQLAANAVAQDLAADIPTEEVSLLKQSGLLLLGIPRTYGGAGATFPELYQITRILAQAQGSVGQLYANHITLIHMAAALGRPGQAEDYYRLTADQNLFWANAFNALDQRLKIEPADDGFRVNGTKSFGTGVVCADINAFTAVQAGVDAPVVFVIPKERAGVSYNYDWNNMGQRRTASGSYTFENVWVAPEEIVGPPPLPEGGFPTLIFLVAQISKIYTYLGIAEGALTAAKNYTSTQSRPWLTSGVEKATQDPYILHRYGEYWTELQAALALANQTASALQTAWEKGTEVTAAERGELAILVAAAKATAIKTGLTITNHMFDLMGARATAARYGFDRYWRDLRTFSLHDPIDYKFKHIGNWLLNQEYPTPSAYS
ncbi:MAG: monooxygenase [Leptolyngbya sp. SIO4C1]|nr:monooxygenase [Leptolyngbya sp. SIO4C1]